MTSSIPTSASLRRTLSLPPEHACLPSSSGGASPARRSTWHAASPLQGAIRGRAATVDSATARTRSESPRRALPHAFSRRAETELPRQLLSATPQSQLQQVKAMTVAQRNAVEAQILRRLHGGSPVDATRTTALWLAVQTARLQSGAQVVAPAGWVRSEAAQGMDQLMGAMTGPTLGDATRAAAARVLGDHLHNQGPGPFLNALGYTLSLEQIPAPALAFAAEVRQAVAKTRGSETVARFADALRQHGIPDQVLPLLAAGAASQEEAMAVLGRYQSALSSLAG